jgi:hypothetical protein
MQPIESMSFAELLEHLSKIDKHITPGHGAILTKRLYEIALLDHHVRDEDRSEALRILDAVKQSMESVLGSDALDVYRQANELMETGALRMGVGSLAWLIEEHGIPHDEIAAFVSRPEHESLREDLYVILDPNVAEALKAQVEKLSRAAKEQ